MSSIPSDLPDLSTLSNSPDADGSGAHSPSDTGTFNAVVAGLDEPCTVYLDPRDRRLYQFFDGEILLPEVYVVCYPTVASVKAADGTEQFVPVGSYGVRHPQKPYAIEADLGKLDMSKNIDTSSMPKGMTLEMLLDDDGSALERIGDQISKVDESSANTHVGGPSAPSEGWQKAAVGSVDTNRNKAVQDFCWSMANSASRPMNIAREFQPIPHDTTLLVLCDAVACLEVSFDTSKPDPSAFEFYPAHCRGVDGSVGPGLHVGLVGSEAVTAHREQLAVFERKLFDSAHWKDLQSKYFGLSLPERDSEIKKCVEETWSELEKSTSS